MNRTATDRSGQYWASLSTEEIIAQLQAKVDDYRQYLLTSNKLALWKACWNQYYKAESRIGLSTGGDRSQYKILGANHYASLIQGLVSVVCQQNPAFEPVSINSDTKSMSQTLVAKSVLDYYMRVCQMPELFKDDTEIGHIFGEAFLYFRWNALLGQVVEVSKDQDGNDKPIYEGDIDIVKLNPMDVVRDYTRTDTKNDWFILVEYVNKWNLIAQRPDLKDEIIGETIGADLQRYRFGHMVDEQGEMDDLVPKYTFIHEKTPAMPAGRIVEYVGDAVILDTGLPFDKVTVLRFTPSNVIQSNFGCTVATKLLPLQQAYDTLCSIIITNASNWGLGNIQIPLGTNVKIEQIVDGLNAIRVNAAAGEIKPLVMPSTPAEIFQMLDRIESMMEKIAGISAILRGQAPANLKSGTALAFMQAQSLVFNSSTQQSYISMVENSGTTIVNILKTFANSKRMITIAGKAKKTYMKYFDKNDLSNISRVMVNVGNPLTKTIAGKVQIAQDLLQGGLITTPQEYTQVLETGTLDPLLEGQTAELMLIRQENEEMSEGRIVTAIVTENHPLHIQEHKTVLSSPEAKNNPEIVQNVLSHMMEHINLMQTADPRLLQMLGIQPLQPQIGSNNNPAGIMSADVPVQQEAESIPPPEGPSLPPGTDAQTQQASQQLNAQ